MICKGDGLSSPDERERKSVDVNSTRTMTTIPVNDKMNNQTHNLAEQIAQLLQNSEKGSDDFLRSSLEKINQRLDKIESQTNPKSQIPNPKLFHSSQEKFTNLEELADEIINGLQNEKVCPYEPTAKPCDNCSMCNSRGF